MPPKMNIYCAPQSWQFNSSDTAVSRLRIFLKTKSLYPLQKSKSWQRRSAPFSPTVNPSRTNLPKPKKNCEISAARSSCSRSNVRNGSGYFVKQSTATAWKSDWKSTAFQGTRSWGSWKIGTRTCWSWMCIKFATNSSTCLWRLRRIRGKSE